LIAIKSFDKHRCFTYKGLNTIVLTSSKVSRFWLVSEIPLSNVSASGEATRAKRAWMEVTSREEIFIRVSSTKFFGFSGDLGTILFSNAELPNGLYGEICIGKDYTSVTFPAV
jgi:hypothetical protein